MPIAVAISGVTFWIVTPSQPRSTAPPERSCATTVFTVFDGMAKPTPTEPPFGE